MKADPYTHLEVLDQSYYEAIGHAIYIWAGLENDIDIFLLDMLRDKKADEVRAAHSITKLTDIRSNLRSRIDLINELTPCFYDKDHCELIRRVLKRAAKFYRGRNHLAHGDWEKVRTYATKTQPAKTEIFSTVRYKGVVRYKGTSFTPKSIDALGVRIEAVLRDFNNLIFGYSPKRLPGAKRSAFDDTLPNTNTI